MVSTTLRLLAARARSYSAWTSDRIRRVCRLVLTSGGQVCHSRAVTKWSSPIRRPSAVPNDRRTSMKARIIGAALLAAVCAVAATSATGGTKKAQADITVWLQVDAQSGWPDVVAAATAAFQKQHPGVGVKVQYQTWGTHLGKFDATLAGGNTPDVIEMGNTEMTKYMAAGAFQDLTSMRSRCDNSRSLLEGLAASDRYNGKLLGLQYYDGPRVVTYRSDQYRQAGIKAAP